jgi:hypothetical protein
MTRHMREGDFWAFSRCIFFSSRAHPRKRFLSFRATFSFSEFASVRQFAPKKCSRDAPGICVPGGHNARAPHAGLVARDPVAYLDAKPRVTRPPLRASSAVVTRVRRNLANAKRAHRRVPIPPPGRDGGPRGSPGVPE